MNESDDSPVVERPDYDDGDPGSTWLRAALVMLFTLAMALIYSRVRFHGLRHAEAMEYADVARNLATGRGFTTQCHRPSDLWFAGRSSATPPAPVSPAPDLRHAPVFPGLLSAAMRLAHPRYGARPADDVPPAESRVVAPFTAAFAVLTAGFVFLIGRRLFGERVAMLGALAYAVSDVALAAALDGTPGSLLAFLVCGAAYFAVLATRNRADSRPVLSWLAPLLLSTAFCGAAFLTKYRMLLLAPALAAFVAAPFGPRRLPVAAGFLALVLLAASPWLLRNVQVAGSPFGMAPYAVLRNAPGYEGDAFDRSPAPLVSNDRIAHAVRGKLAEGIRRACVENLPALGGIALAFFLVSLFLPLADPEPNRLRWCLLLALGLAVVSEAAAGRAGEASSLAALVPLVAPFGAAFFVWLTDRTRDLHPQWETVLAWLWVGLAAIPTGLRLLHPGGAAPYPPYYPPFVSYACQRLERTESIATDIPWAAAWYGDRPAWLLPNGPGDLAAMEKRGVTPAALYITSPTGEAQGADAAAGVREWGPIHAGRLPPGFRYPHGIEFPAGQRDQLFLTTRPRE
jgi:hypothetical protein